MRVGVDFEEPLEGEHFAEHAGHLRGGQRRVALQVADRPRQVLVQAVAQLVRQRHHVAQLVGEIHQDVGVGAGHGAAAEALLRLPGRRAASIQRFSKNSRITAPARG